MRKEKLLVIKDGPSVAKQLKWALNQTYDVTGVRRGGCPAVSFLIKKHSINTT